MNAISAVKPAFKSLNDAMAHWARETPEAPAITFLEDGAGTALSYRALHERALCIAHELTTVARPGDRAVLVFEQGLDYVASFLACSYAGVVAVTGASPDELRRTERLMSLIVDSGAEIVLTHGEAASKLTVLERLDQNLFVLDIGQLDGRSLAAPLFASGDDLMFLQYTSGSTSAPKGVMLSHRSIMANLAAICRTMQVDETSVHVSWLPLYHDMGLILMTLSTLYKGRPLYLMSPGEFLRHPLRWLEAVSRYRATMTAAPDFAYRLCLETATSEDLASLDLSSLRVMLNGAEPIRVANVEAFHDTFRAAGLRREAVIGGYGMAEVGVFCTVGPMLDRVRAFDARALEGDRVAVPCDRSEPFARLIAHCGEVDAQNYDLRIVHPDTRTELEPGRVGEIWLAGASVGEGYWDNPKATRATFNQRLPGADKAYLRTGDFGFVADGRLHICGRHKEMMIVRGRNIFPADLCEIVENTTPAMRGRRAAAFSVEGEQGEEVYIVCAARVDADTAQAVAREIVAAVVSAVGITPAGVLFVENRVLKRTTSGKVRHGAMRQDFVDGTLDISFQVMASARHGQATREAREVAVGDAPAGLEVPEPPDWVVQKVCRACATVCECPAVDRHDNLFELGLDSLRAMRLIAVLERHMDAPEGMLRLSDIVDLKTPRNIAQALLVPARPAGQDQAPAFMEMTV